MCSIFEKIYVKLLQITDDTHSERNRPVLKVAVDNGLVVPWVPLIPMTASKRPTKDAADKNLLG